MRVVNLFYQSAVTQKVTVDDKSVLRRVSANLVDGLVSADQAISCNDILTASVANSQTDAQLIFVRADNQQNSIGMEFSPGQVLYCTINPGAPSGFLQLIFDEPSAVIVE